MLSKLLSSRGTRDLASLILLMLIFSCGTSKPPAETLKTISSEGLDLKPGEYREFHDGNIIVGISADSALYFSKKPAQKDRAPLIDYTKIKDKSTVQVNSDNKIKEKVNEAKRVDKSQVDSGNKNKGKTKTDNSTDNSSKSLFGVPWYVWLLLLLAIAFGLNKIFKWVPWI